MSKRPIVDMVIGLAGFSYIIVVLSQNIQNPVFAGIFILAASYEMIESHHGRPRT
jgi:hypothetical protein